MSPASTTSGDWPDWPSPILAFDHTFDHGGEPFSVRMVYVHMIGEYARHNGHADLLREHVDGITGR
jgi:hypothetical protein